MSILSERGVKEEFWGGLIFEISLEEVREQGMNFGEECSRKREYYVQRS